MKTTTQNNQSNVPVGWRKLKVSDFCDITRGASPRPIHKFISNQGTPWVKIADATSSDSRYISSTKEFIVKDGESKSRVVYPGDFILSNSATPGLPRIMKIRACVHDGWLLLRNIKGVDKFYLYYLLLTQREKLLIQGNGSIFTNLKTDILKKHEVLIPSLDEQFEITSILQAIDDKIELNRKMNKTLEEMGKALFKRWFVDFEFPAENGKPYKSSGGEMVESELGVIPKGWDVFGYDSIIDICGGGTPRTTVDEYWNGSIPFYTPKDSNNDLFVVETEKNVTDLGVNKSSTKIYPEDTVFITARGTVGNINMAGVPMAMNQSCYALVGKHAYLTYLLTTNKVQELIQRTHGAVFSTITTSTFQSIKMAWPNTDFVDKFSQTITPLFDLIKKIQKKT